MPAAELRRKATPLSHQEAIGGYAECGVMMKAAPAAAFELAQSEFLLIQGQESFQVASRMYCWVAATPVDRRAFPNRGLPAFEVGSSSDELTVNATVPITGIRGARCWGDSYLMVQNG
jgi:hypothetical protein